MSLYNDDDEPGLDDREMPDRSDMDAHGDQDVVDTVPCPSCGKPVYDGAEQCPRCGNYLSKEEHAAEKATWIIVTGFVCLVIVVLWVLWWH
jgi:predicted nucleic acid-binding Zn ribbon protein